MAGYRQLFRARCSDCGNFFLLPIKPERKTTYYCSKCQISDKTVAYQRGFGDGKKGKKENRRRVHVSVKWAYDNGYKAGEKEKAGDSR